MKGSKKYDPRKIESKLQKEWEKNKLYKAKDFSKKPKFYGLIEFPYPSGEGLHVGHIRSNTAMDIITRKRRMQGYNVLYPIGWDAFGLPTENYAIKTGIEPAKVTKKNTDTFRRQLKAGGFSFDWTREINTTDPRYYKWTQWIFLKLFEKGLAYKSKMPINWCLSCKIGLANEEVLDGKCERCGGSTEKREKEQWMLGITKYADRLDKDLDTVDYLPKIKTQQRNWIGKSEGSEIGFGIKNSESKIRVFTTRADTLFGATYLVLAPEHSLLTNNELQIKNYDEVKKHIADAKKKTDEERLSDKKDKTGIELKGVKAINPANNEEIPIFVADYVLAKYGTGAIMAVPAHDQRDFEFAKKFNLPIKQVIAPHLIDPINPLRPDKPTIKRRVIQGIVKHWKEDKILAIKWKKQSWTTFVIGGAEGNETGAEAAAREIREETGFKNFKITRQIGGKIFSEFYAAHKEENRYADMEIYLAELKDGECEELSAEEKEKHEITWLPIDKIPTDINPCNEKYIIYDSLKNGERAFDGEGVLVNSGKFNNMTSSEARKKITEFVGGEKKTTFKLRDWVFSRQRYWGEPIPMIRCEYCASKKSKFIVIHGYTGRADKNFIPWLKKELEGKGFEVQAPQLPNTDHPKKNEQVEHILKNCNIDEQTVIVGHSLGAVVAMKLLQKINKPIAGLVIVAAAIEPKHDPRGDSKPFWKTFSWNIDYVRLRKLTNFRIILSDTREKKLRGKYLQLLTEKLEAAISEFKAEREHFCGINEPAILDSILSATGNSGWIPVPEKDLPVKLPNVLNYKPTDTGESPLAAMEKWVNVKCPQCGGKARRETDTMPNWAGSSWYYLRYVDSKNTKAFADIKKLKYWTPVDWYNGGMEHTTLHLLYSRFWHKFLFDHGFVPTPEPYNKRTSHGLVLGEGGEKMSKSKGNVVNPDEIVKTYGADTLRVYEMFMGPFDQSVAWSTDSIIGSRRFLEKVWRLADKVESEKTKSDKSSEAHALIKKVGEDIEAMKFNTAISAMMVFAGDLEKREQVNVKDYEALLLVLSPFAPHIADELWRVLGHKKSIHTEKWPVFDERKIISERVVIAVQVNGKLRGTFNADPNVSEDEAKKTAQNMPEVSKWLEGKPIKKVVYVKGRLINIVI